MLDPVDPLLWEESKNFAERLNYVVGEVLPGPLPTFKAEEKAETLVLVSADPLPIYRQNEDSPFVLLDVSFHCAWSSQKPILAAHKSTFRLRVPGGGPPVLHADYIRDPTSNAIPVAHYNVASQHPGLLRMVDPKGRAKHAHAVAEMTRKLHLPVGGHRFRPTLEDMLMMLIHEFNIQRLDDWEEPLRNNRGAFRETQTAAAVRDHPSKAIEELERMGYSITKTSEAEDSLGSEIREQFFRY